MTETNFQKHLYFETRPNSEEYKINACMKILEMIASLKDRNASMRYEFERPKYEQNLRTIKRLKSYYNYRLSLLKSFSI